MQTAGSRRGALATVEPDPDAEVCVRHDCARSDGLQAIDPHSQDHERRVLCPEHAFAYLEEIAR